MNYVFGPVPSRRLGQSLGIDTIPLKTCNWNCVYCQLGRTVPLNNERRVYYPAEAILEEVRQALAAHQPGDIDWVTFVGSGEPTLHSDIGRLIRDVKRMSDLPVAVITNGALLYQPEVRRDLAEADAVLPSLDAGDAELYRHLNRPHPACSFARLVDGLVAFRQEYTGRLWLEVMLIKGLNDSPAALRAIANHVAHIRPDEVHWNLPLRPPAEPWVQPSDDEGIMRAQAILGRGARVVHPVTGRFDLSGPEPVEAILALITRHPLQETQLRQALLDAHPGDVDTILADLAAESRAHVVERYGARFWCAAATHHAELGSDGTHLVLI